MVGPETKEPVGYALADAPHYSGVGYNTLFNAIHAGELEAFRVGRKWVVPKYALEDWMRRRVAATKEAESA